MSGSIVGFSMVWITGHPFQCPEAMGSGGHGRPREATGGHGFGNFGAGDYLGRLDSGGHGKPWAREATGGHGRPREAMGSVTLGLGITSAGWALEITLGLGRTFLKL